jgi:uncharacterized alkaline shock family protein YloU
MATVALSAASSSTVARENVRRVDVAETAAAAALAVDGVISLHAGAVGEIATYGGGARVHGVRVSRGDEPTVTIHVRMAYGRPLPDIGADIAASVRSAVEDALGVRPVVEVRVADVVECTARPSAGSRDQGRAGPRDRPQVS